MPTTPPPMTPRALDPIVATDRAIADHEMTDRSVASAANAKPFDPNPDPLNRRGLRHFEASVRRTERQSARARRRAMLAR
ncbi:MAG: hypothetical protein ABJB61_15160 [bacterium]